MCSPYNRLTGRRKKNRFDFQTTCPASTNFLLRVYGLRWKIQFICLRTNSISSHRTAFAAMVTAKGTRSPPIRRTRLRVASATNANSFASVANSRSRSATFRWKRTSYRGPTHDRYKTSRIINKHYCAGADFTLDLFRSLMIMNACRKNTRYHRTLQSRLKPWTDWRETMRRSPNGPRSRHVNKNYK